MTVEIGFFRKYENDFKRFVPPLGDEWGEVGLVDSIIKYSILGF